MTTRTWAANGPVRNGLSVIAWTASDDERGCVNLLLHRASGGTYYALEFDQAKELALTLLSFMPTEIKR